jgi:hypothetical protein
MARAPAPLVVFLEQVSRLTYTDKENTDICYEELVDLVSTAALDTRIVLCEIFYEERVVVPCEGIAASKMRVSEPGFG